MLVSKGLELFLLSVVVGVIVLIGPHLNSSYHLNAFHSSVRKSKESSELFQQCKCRVSLQHSGPDVSFGVFARALSGSCG